MGGLKAVPAVPGIHHLVTSSSAGPVGFQAKGTSGREFPFDTEASDLTESKTPSIFRIYPNFRAV